MVTDIYKMEYMYSWSSTRPIKLNNSKRDTLFTFCCLHKLLFTSWLFVVVSRANNHFEEVQNWLETTLKQRNTWWNQKSIARLFVYKFNVTSRFVPMDLSHPDDSYPGLDVSYPHSTRRTPPSGRFVPNKLWHKMFKTNINSYFIYPSNRKKANL